MKDFFPYECNKEQYWQEQMHRVNGRQTIPMAWRIEREEHRRQYCHQEEVVGFQQLASQITLWKISVPSAMRLKDPDSSFRVSVLAASLWTVTFPGLLSSQICPRFVQIIQTHQGWMMEKQDSSQVVHVNRKSVLVLQNHVQRNDRWQGVAEQHCSSNVGSPKSREEVFFSKWPSKGNLAVNKILGLFTILLQLEVQI